MLRLNCTSEHCSNIFPNVGRESMFWSSFFLAFPLWFCFLFQDNTGMPNYAQEAQNAGTFTVGKSWQQRRGSSLSCNSHRWQIFCALADCFAPGFEWRLSFYNSKTFFHKQNIVMAQEHPLESWNWELWKAVSADKQLLYNDWYHWNQECSHQVGLRYRPWTAIRRLIKTVNKQMIRGIECTV